MDKSLKGECVNCGGTTIITMEQEPMPFGEAPDTVTLMVMVPVHTCIECDFEFTDDIAEEARDGVGAIYLQTLEQLKRFCS